MFLDNYASIFGAKGMFIENFMSGPSTGSTAKDRKLNALESFQGIFSLHSCSKFCAHIKCFFQITLIYFISSEIDPLIFRYMYQFFRRCIPDVKGFH